MISAYSKEAMEVISKSSFEIHKGNFVYAKVNSIASIDEHFLVTKDADEITVVTAQKNVAGLDLIERNKDDYRLIALNVSVPFYSIGFWPP